LFRLLIRSCYCSVACISLSSKDKNYCSEDHQTIAQLPTSDSFHKYISNPNRDWEVGCLPRLASAVEDIQRW
jgi:hypothetical protein